MPVVIKPAGHNANIAVVYQPAFLEEDLLKRACSKEYADCNEFLQSSFTSFDTKSPLRPVANGFVHAAITAYNGHHHLTIRPEDVWFAILTQLSLYINKHAEELRHKFVAHEDRKELQVTRGGTRYTVDFGEMSEEMGRKIEENIIDQELKVWVIPDFTTTTQQDIVVASVILMGSMQKYFNYKFKLLCGIPSVTLLGEQSDWQKLLERLEKLKTLGEETVIWYKLLKPVLSRFVLSFEYPQSSEVCDFWNKIVHCESLGSGSSNYSGWITAFCFWNDRGNLLYNPPPPSKPLPSKPPSSSQNLILDGCWYHRIDTVDVPPGYSSVPVKVNGDVFMSRLIAGSVGIKYTSSGNEAANGMTGLDTLQPETGWMIYETKEEINDP